MTPVAVPLVSESNREVLLALLDQIEQLLADVRVVVVEHETKNEVDDQHGR